MCDELFNLNKIRICIRSTFVHCLIFVAEPELDNTTSSKNKLMPKCDNKRCLMLRHKRLNNVFLQVCNDQLARFQSRLAVPLLLQQHGDGPCVPSRSDQRQVGLLFRSPHSMLLNCPTSHHTFFNQNHSPVSACRRLPSMRELCLHFVFSIDFALTCIRWKCF